MPSMGGPALTRYHVASLAVLNYNYLIFSSQNVMYADKMAVLCEYMSAGPPSTWKPFHIYFFGGHDFAVTKAA